MVVWAVLIVQKGLSQAWILQRFILQNCCECLPNPKKNFNKIEQFKKCFYIYKIKILSFILILFGHHIYILSLSKLFFLYDILFHALIFHYYNILSLFHYHLLFQYQFYFVDYILFHSIFYCYHILLQISIIIIFLSFHSFSR